MTSRRPKVFTASDPEPDLNPGDVLAVNYGNYQIQEIWVVDGANTGAIFPFGGLHHKVDWVEVTRPTRPRRDLLEPDHDACPRHPRWADVVARGPVTVLNGMPQHAYDLGWRDGRRDLLGEIESLAEESAPDMPDVSPVPAAKVGDLYGASATAIAANVVTVLDSENNRWRRAVGDERYSRDDITDDLNYGQEYDWVCVGYGRHHGTGEPSGGWCTTEGLLDYAPLEVLQTADNPEVPAQ